MDWTSLLYAVVLVYFAYEAGRWSMRQQIKDETEIAYFDFVNLENNFSNFFTLFPCAKIGCDRVLLTNFFSKLEINGFPNFIDFVLIFFF